MEQPNKRREINRSRRQLIFSFILFMVVLLTVLLILLTGCEKRFENYYRVPDDLIGTILDVLEEDGNYTQFVKAVKLIEFDDVLGKTGNFTVFAPDDAAFTDFLSEEEYANLEEIPIEELEGIVYYHIVFWAYSKFMLLYGLNIQDAEIEYSALNFKQPTQYKPPLTVEYDTFGRAYDVYHETKFIPIFSDEYFTELELDAGTNYNFLYPETPYNGFHVDRAEVTEYDVPAQNGWIHRINRVLKPPPNHGDILKERNEFSIFRDLIEKESYFQYSSSYTTAQNNEGDIDEDGILDSLFLKMNNIFPSGSSPDLENVASNGRQNTLTLFAPTNSALQAFLSERTTGYGSMDQFGEFWINWYLSHYIGMNYWPSEYGILTQEWEWDLTSSLMDCNIDEGDIHYSLMASNGPFCGINKYFLPKIFESVAQPIFGNRDYEWFCNMLVFYLADRLLNDENLEFTLFVPTNEAIDQAGYIFRGGLGGFGLYGPDPFYPISRKEGTDIVNSHIIFGVLSESDFEEGTFIETAQGTFLGITAEGIFAGGDKSPSIVGESEIVGGRGIIYKIDRMLVAPDESIFEVISDPVQYPQYQKFYQLCYESGLINLDSDNQPQNLDNVAVGTSYSCFIPTNESIEAGRASGLIPTDADSVKQFLRYHFVEGVIFPDGEKSGIFNTTRVDEENPYLFSQVEVLNQKYDLKVMDNLGNIRNVITSNHIVEDGVIHQIDSFLLFE